MIPRKLKKRMGKRGGLASHLVDVYSMFFYVFVLIVFMTLFSIHRGCSNEAREFSISSELDRGLEAKMLLFNLLRTPVGLQDGRMMEFGEVIILNELPGEDLESEIVDIVTTGVEDYLLQGFDEPDDDDEQLVSQGWGMRIDYRSGTEVLEFGERGGSADDALSQYPFYNPHPFGGGGMSYPGGYYAAQRYQRMIEEERCGYEVPAAAVLPLVFDSTSESQVVEITLVICSKFLGMQGGDITS